MGLRQFSIQLHSLERELVRPLKSRWVEKVLCEPD